MEREALKLVLEILKYRFGMNVTEPSLRANYTLDQISLGKCFALGNRVAESLIPKA
jgi:hypothetical protein